MEFKYKTTSKERENAKQVFGCEGKNPLDYLVNSNVTIGQDESMLQQQITRFKQHISKK